MLTSAHRDALDAEGWVVVPGALDARWLERLRAAFSGAPAQSDGTQHVGVDDGVPHPEAWEAIRKHPVTSAAAEHVLRAPFRVRDLHGRNPLPGYGQQGLHADWMPRKDGSRFFVLTAIWMLDDFTVDNGATRVVPRTHRIPHLVPKTYAQPLARHPDEVVVTGKAGSVLVFNGHTWHSGRRNQSSGPRRCGQMVIEREPGP
ncbi:MAG TPA: phytanoyl-CoA dioxygenase family protein [Polyangiaceae bacterium]